LARRVLKDRVGLSLTSVVRNRRKLASRSWRRYGSHGNDQQEQPDRVTSVIACWMLCCVVDCRTTLLGSLNPLSHRDTREVMVEHEGQWFATSLLQHEHAEHFANPPECGVCKATAELRRATPENPDPPWSWQCGVRGCSWTKDATPPGITKGSA
jgi:hypothetical protein